MNEQSKLYKAKQELVTPLIGANQKKHVIKPEDLVLITPSRNKNFIIDCGSYGWFHAPEHLVKECFDLMDAEAKSAEAKKVKIDLDDLLKTVYKEVAQSLDIPETELVCTEDFKTPFGTIKKGAKASIKNNKLKVQNLAGEWIVITYNDAFELLRDVTLHFTAAKKEEPKKEELKYKCSPMPEEVKNNCIGTLEFTHEDWFKNRSKENESKEAFEARVNNTKNFCKNFQRDLIKTYIGKKKKLFLNCEIKNGGIASVNQEAHYGFHKAKRAIKKNGLGYNVKPCLIEIAEPDPQQRLFNFLYDEFGIIALQDELSTITNYLKEKKYE